MIKKKQEQQSHRVDLAEKQADAQDLAMMIADDPELIELYNLDISSRKSGDSDE